MSVEQQNPENDALETEGTVVEQETAVPDPADEDALLTEDESTDPEPESEDNDQEQEDDTAEEEPEEELQEEPSVVTEEEPAQEQLLPEKVERYAPIVKAWKDHAVRFAPTNQASKEECRKGMEKLLRATNRLWMLQNAEFRRAIIEIMDVVYENRKGAFHATHFFRGFAEANLTPKARRFNHRLLGLIGKLADPTGRKIAAKMLDIKTLVDFAPDKKASQLIATFFSSLKQ